MRKHECKRGLTAIYSNCGISEQTTRKGFYLLSDAILNEAVSNAALRSRKKGQVKVYSVLVIEFEMNNSNSNCVVKWIPISRLEQGKILSFPDSFQEKLDKMVQLIDSGNFTMVPS